MDDNYPTNIRRMMRSTLPGTYEGQVQHLQSSPKFERLESGRWAPRSFPGYTIITPPGNDPSNAELYQQVSEQQQQILEALGPDLLIPVPAESFHLTIADLIWNDAVAHAKTVYPEFEDKLRSIIATSFEQNHHLKQNQPIQFKVAGLMIMPRALALALVATDETSYNQIVELRRSIYQNPQLMAIGIEQQYHFTAHITLGYFGDLPADRSTLVNQVDQFNQRWMDSESSFWVKQAELRSFPDMTCYERSENWPTFVF